MTDTHKIKLTRGPDGFTSELTLKDGTVISHGPHPTLKQAETQNAEHIAEWEAKNAGSLKSDG